MHTRSLPIAVAAFAIVLAFGLGAGCASLLTIDSNFLGFAGSLIGTAGAVFGAMWVVNYQKHEERKVARTHTRSLITAAVDTLNRLEIDLEASAYQTLSKEEHFDILKTHCQALIDIGDELRDFSIHLSVGFFPKVFTLKQRLSVHRSFFEQVVQTDPKKWDGSNRAEINWKLQESLESLGRYARAAIIDIQN